MDEVLTPIQLLVKQSVANEIQQKQLTEIVLRSANAKYREFAKCKVLNNCSDPEMQQQLLSTVLNLESNDQQILNSVNSVLRKCNLADKKLSNIDVNIQNLATKADFILGSAKQLQALSYLNVGATLANIAIDVVEFDIIKRKVDEVKDTVEAMQTDVTEIKEQGRSAICEKFSRYCQIYNSYVNDCKNKLPLDLSKLQDLLIDLNSYMEKTLLQQFMVTKDYKDSYLSMLFVLLPEYTSLLKLYLKSYYLKGFKEHENYQSFLSIYQKLNSDVFRRKMEDYLLLDAQMSYRQTIETINSQLNLLLDYRLSLDDLLILLSAFDTEDKFEEWEKCLKETAENIIYQKIGDISLRSGVDVNECARVLATA